MKTRRATIELADNCTVQVEPWHEAGPEISRVLSMVRVWGGDRRLSPHGEIRALHSDDLLRLAELLCFVTGYAPPQTVDVRINIFGRARAPKAPRK